MIELKNGRIESEPVPAIEKLATIQLAKSSVDILQGKGWLEKLSVWLLLDI